MVSIVSLASGLPMCVACNSPLTVTHIMLDCVDFDPVRTDDFYVGMKELYEKVQADSILAYLKRLTYLRI